MKTHWRESLLLLLFAFSSGGLLPAVLTCPPPIRLVCCASLPSPYGPVTDFRNDRVNISHGLSDHWQNKFNLKCDALAN